MKSTFFNRYFPKFRNFARLFTASVSLLFSSSVFAQDANTAAIAADVESILQSLNWALRNPISSDSGYIPERLDDLLEYDTATYKFLTGRTSTTASINYNDKNALPYLLGSVVYGLTGWAPNSSQPLDHSLHGDLTTGNQTLAQLLALLHNISNVVAQSASTVVVSNFVSVTNSGGGVFSPDILAGNPWWSTNSGFVLSAQNLGIEYPKDPADHPGVFSFPEFLSAWSSRLQSPFSRPTEAQLADRYNWWGRNAYLSQSSISDKINRNFTWFDLMADWMSSNSVASNSRHFALINLLRNISNELNDSSAYIANHLDASLGDSNFYLSNIVNVLSGISPDILAGNPWWYTNSLFVSSWYNWSLDHPYPRTYVGTYFTFPELLSLMSSQKTLGLDYKDGEVYSFADYYNAFGADEDYNAINWNGDGLTWYDWIADAWKSNFVLSTSSSYSNLFLEVSQHDTSDDSNPTNVPLPEYSLPNYETVAGASETLSSAESGILEKIESMQPNYTGGDDEIVVIPSFSVGGINVQEYRARLGTSITPVCRRVASFIWYVGLFAFLFAFAKSEVVYYATLGKFWVHKG